MCIPILCFVVPLRMSESHIPSEKPRAQRSGIKTLRREDEIPFPKIPDECKEMVWIWLRNWKLTARKLNWSDYVLGRLLDNIEESYGEGYYNDNGNFRERECLALYEKRKVSTIPCAIPISSTVTHE